jgi:hypothetical protein
MVEAKKPSHATVPLTIVYLLQKTDGQCYIWGRRAKFLAVEYVDHQGKKRKSKLLLR